MHCVGMNVGEIDGFNAFWIDDISVSGNWIKAGEKHHFAVTWDREGFGIGAEYLRAFWDGTNIGGTTIDKRADVAAIPNISVGRNIVAMYNGIRPANMMIDNLKIYSTWKTNFSDRTVE